MCQLSHINNNKRNKMMHKFENDFYLISEEIISEKKNNKEWAEIESDDMFQRGNYEGGFDSTEMEFCFRVFINEREYWFQLPLQSIEKVYLRQLDVVDVRLAEL